MCRSALIASSAGTSLDILCEQRQGIGSGERRQQLCERRCNGPHLCWPCVLLLEAAALNLGVQLLALRVDAGAGGVEEPAPNTPASEKRLPDHAVHQVRLEPSGQRTG